LQLKERGHFKALETINPTQSPVVWSSIASGKNPGHHGVFDFIKRDPSSYLPELSIVQFNKLNVMGKKSKMFSPVRRGETFWNIASAHNIPVKVIRWPLTLPCDEIKGAMLAGLGVPDLKGTLGRYALYTSNEDFANKERGDVIVVKKSPCINTNIIGPDKTVIAMAIDLTDAGVTLKIQDATYHLKEKTWSDWIKVQFAINPFKKVRGITRFYLESTSPHLHLYMLPLQPDPNNSPYPLSSPLEYTEELARAIGPFATTGMPEDTTALNENVLSPRAFLSLCDDIFQERTRMLFYELERFEKGIFAFVFDTLDRIQHVFYKINKADMKEAYSGVIEEYYKKIDTLVGKVLSNIDEDTTLVIISDHGFTYYDKSFHMNRWLIEKGFLKLTTPNAEGIGLFKNVAWNQTRAYALGFSSIYINLKGRESQGIVERQEAHELKSTIAKALEEYEDACGNRPIERVYTSEELFDGPYSDSAPDLVVGFKPGYRMSWQTAVGAAPLEMWEENDKYWASDHIVDASFVPGVFFINKKMERAPVLSVLDIAPLVLNLAGISA